MHTYIRAVVTLPTSENDVIVRQPRSLSTRLGLVWAQADLSVPHYSYSVVMVTDAANGLAYKLNRYKPL